MSWRGTKTKDQDTGSLISFSGMTEGEATTERMTEGRAGMTEGRYFIAMQQIEDLMKS